MPTLFLPFLAGRQALPNYLTDFPNMHVRTHTHTHTHTRTHNTYTHTHTFTHLGDDGHDHSQDAQHADHRGGEGGSSKGSDSDEVRNLIQGISLMEHGAHVHARARP